jgi:hypothetical protein
MEGRVFRREGISGVMIDVMTVSHSISTALFAMV